MLASRGAVYHTRKTAGDFKSFHRGCDCKVVPGFEDDPDAELVEGIKPGEMRDQWWKFEKIDATEGLSPAERNRMKRLVLDGGELPEEVKKTNPTARMRKVGRAGSGWISAGDCLDAEVKAHGFSDVTDFYEYLGSRRTAAEIVEAGVLGEKILANADATPKFYELVKGHLHKSVKLADGVSPKELRELYRQFKEIDETEGLSAEQKDARKRKILNLAEARSNPSTRYRAENLDLSELKPGELRKMQKKNPLEWESYVHLSRLGFRQRLLHEQGNATANIDIVLYLDGTWNYWDMKTIEGGVHAIKKRMTECHSKWVRLSSKEAVLPEGIDIDLLDAPRVVIDNRFSKISDAEAEEQIRKSKDFLSGRDGFSFAQALLICKNGTTKMI